MEKPDLVLGALTPRLRVFLCLLVVASPSLRQGTALPVGERLFHRQFHSSDNDDTITMIQTRVQTHVASLVEELNTPTDQMQSARNVTIGVLHSHQKKGLPKLESESLISATSARSSADGNQTSAHAKVGEPEPLSEIAKHIDAPRRNWAITFLVLSSLLVIGSIFLAFWMFMHSGRDGKPLCSLSFKVVAALLLTILAVGVTYLASFYFSGVLLKQLITHFDVAFLGVHVTMQNVLLNPFNGVLTLEDLQVANPKGYNSDYLLKAQTLLIDIDMLPLVFSLFKRVDVSTVKLSGVRAIYEQALTSSNVVDLMNHLKGDAKQQNDGTETQVVLHEVALTDCWVKGTLQLTGNHGISVAVPNTYYKDFHKDVGVSEAHTIRAIIDVILGTLLKSILHAVSP